MKSRKPKTESRKEPPAQTPQSSRSETAPTPAVDGALEQPAALDGAVTKARAAILQAGKTMLFSTPHHAESEALLALVPGIVCEVAPHVTASPLYMTLAIRFAEGNRAE